MNRQKIKYLMCLIYNLIGILIVYNFVTGIIDYKTFGRFCLDMLPFLFYLALSFTFLVTNIDTNTGIHKKTRISTFFYPKLPKKIVHESGDYYIKYNKEDKYYDIYLDNYFSLKRVFRIDDDYVHTTNDILKKVKETLDSKYKDKMDKLNRLKQKEDALKQWDGYTSVHEKRDDKIKQLTS